MASCGSALGHLAVFLIAVRAVGVDASWSLLLVTGLVVMIGSAIPLNVAGWGPREGLTAVATLPGALVLVGDAVARRNHARVDEQEPEDAGQLEGVRRG